MEGKLNSMKIKVDNENIIFNETELTFLEKNICNVFANKNNKTLRETIRTTKYFKYSSIIEDSYHNDLDVPLGEFLLKLKQNNDSFYKKFLNSHGDKLFCNFKIMDPVIQEQKGLYISMVNDEVKYFGRCLDNFKKRINSG